jgi:hypothetical protein
VRRATGLLWTIGVAVLLLVVAYVTYGAALDIHPLDGDNLIAISIADRPTPRFLTDDFVTYVPGYRPLAYLTLWAQYQALGDGTVQLFAFNLLAAVAAALATYAIAVVATGARLLALLPATAFLLDERAVFSQIWLGERQSTLACALGAAAFALAVPALQGPLSRPRLAAIAVLILAASSCKEYGIAFAAGIVVLALLGARERRYALAAAAIFPVVIYLVARAALADLSLAGYCETMGFPGKGTRAVCYDDLGVGERLAQQGWNVIATFAGTFVAPLFDGAGAPQSGVAVSKLLIPLATLALAAGGMWWRPRVVLALLAVIAVNAVLNLALYRGRNQLAGTLALYVAAGIGFVALARALAAHTAGRAVTAAATCAIAAWLVVQGARRSDFVHETRATFAAMNPCDALHTYPRDVDAGVTRTLKVRYGLPDPACTAKPKPKATSG